MIAWGIARFRNGRALNPAGRPAASKHWNRSREPSCRIHAVAHRRAASGDWSWAPHSRRDSSWRWRPIWLRCARRTCLRRASWRKRMPRPEARRTVAARKPAAAPPRRRRRRPKRPPPRRPRRPTTRRSTRRTPMTPTTMRRTAMSRPTITASSSRRAASASAIEGLGRDREYDSFQQFVQDAPWLAGLVFLVVLLVFLIPLLIIVLLIWYKMRKNAHAERDDAEARRARRRAAGGGDGRRRVGHRGLGRCRRAAPPRRTSRLRAGAPAAPAHRVVGSAQGRHPRRSRPRAHVLFDARRRHAEQRRAHPAVRRPRLLRAVVLRGPQQCATRDTPGTRPPGSA